MKLRALLVSLSFAILASSKAVPSGAPVRGDGAAESVFDPALDAYVKLLLDTFHVPGLSVAIVDQGHVAAKGYGFARLPETPATADTLYFTGSTTKAFTAAVAASLVQEKTLTWTSKINDILPDEFILNNWHATLHTTLEDALSHRSGLPRHDLSYSNASTASLVKSLRHLPLTAEPRTRFQYCNLMFATVSRLIQKVTGQDLGAIMKERIWTPLGMNSTFFSLGMVNAASKATDLSRGYYWQESNESPWHGDASSTTSGYFVPEPYIDLNGISGAGAMISSVNDYTLWMQALLDAGGKQLSNVQHSSPITADIYRNIMSPRTILPSEVFPSSKVNRFVHPPDYALGWLTTELEGHVLIFHNGGLDGFGTEVFLLPDDGLGIVTMGNTAGTSNIVGEAIASRIIVGKLGLTEEGLKETVFRSRNLVTAPDRGFRTGYQEAEVPSCPPGTKERADVPRKQQPLQGPKRSGTGSPATIIEACGAPGVYSHPAYGTLNISSECDSGGLLHAIPSPHLWPYEIVLRSLDNASSASSVQLSCIAEFWSPHGPFAADPVAMETGSCDCDDGNGHATAASACPCRNKIVWEKGDGTGLAHFEPGLLGEIERVGIQIDGEMVRQAEEDEESWRDSMIWYERVGESFV